MARKSVQVPELTKAIESGGLTVSKARKITPVLNKDNFNEWIEKAKNLSKFNLEKEVAKANPQLAVEERAKFVQENRLELKMGISEEIHEKLKRAQDLVSQKSRKAANFEITLEVLLDFFIEKNDPLRKAKRFGEKASQEGKTELIELAATRAAAKLLMDGKSSRQEDLIKANALQLNKIDATRGRNFLSSALKHHLHLRDKGQCTYINKGGSRCANTRWLEIHHIKPVSEGGSNCLENLKTLCHTHHRLEHSHG